MNRKWTYWALTAALLLGTHALCAQEPSQEAPPGPPPEQGGLAPGGPVGPRMELLGFGEMHPGKVVTGAPYSAVAITETRQTLADGNVINRKSQSNVFRDSQGRTRRETTFTGFGPLAASGQPRTAIMIHDPVASSAYVLHPDQKTAEQLPARPRGPNGEGRLQARFQARMEQQVANGTLKKEDLGVQTIDGISAQGTRYTHTIPAGKIGNSNPISVVSESWYSPELQVVVKSSRNDPRFGTTTYTLTNIQRTEPAASLFALPSDYTVTQGRMRGMLRHGPRAPRAGAPPADGPGDAPPPQQ